LQQVLSELEFPLPLGDERGVVISGKVTLIEQEWGLAKVAFTGGELWIQQQGVEMGQSVRVRVLARDVSIAISPATDSSIVNLLPATIDAIAEDADSPLALIRAYAGEQPILCRLTRRSLHQLQLQPGLKVWLQVKSAALVR
jgi:molybdate transport system ATP-binding protein